MTARPPGLKSNENGTLGEARARSFLLNRFWVLERSTDVHGADLLIQRRLNTRTAAQRQRLGLVQVKFVQGGDTEIAIPEGYANDEADNVHDEFFLIVCTGTEDGERMYLLTAAELRDTLPLKPRRKTGRVPNTEVPRSTSSTTAPCASPLKAQPSTSLRRR